MYAQRVRFACEQGYANIVLMLGMCAYTDSPRSATLTLESVDRATDTQNVRGYASGS